MEGCRLFPARTLKQIEAGGYGPGAVHLPETTGPLLSCAIGNAGLAQPRSIGVDQIDPSNAQHHGDSPGSAAKTARSSQNP